MNASLIPRRPLRIAAMPRWASLPRRSSRWRPCPEDPSRGTGSGIMQTLQNYGYDIVLLIALLVVASMFVGVCYHAYTRYAEIHTGRATWGQFGLTVAVGAILLVVGIWLLTKATGVLWAGNHGWRPGEPAARRARDLPAAPPQPPPGGRARAHGRRAVGLRRAVRRGRSRGRRTAGLADAQHRDGAHADRRRHRCRCLRGRRPAAAVEARPARHLAVPPAPVAPRAALPALAAHAGGGQLITRSGWWSTRRLRPDPSLRRGRP